MTHTMARLGWMVVLLTAATAANAGPGFDDDQDIVVLRDVPARAAYRPAPKSPNSIGVETSPEEAVNAGLSTIRPMNDAALANGRSNAPNNLISQGLSPITGTVSQMGSISNNGLSNPTIGGGALTAGTARIAPAITGAINGAIMSGLGLSK